MHWAPFHWQFTWRGNCEKLQTMKMEIFSTARYETMNNRQVYEPSEENEWTRSKDNWRRSKEANKFICFHVNCPAVIHSSDLSISNAESTNQKEACGMLPSCPTTFLKTWRARTAECPALQTIWRKFQTRFRFPFFQIILIFHRRFWKRVWIILFKDNKAQHYFRHHDYSTTKNTYTLHCRLAGRCSHVIGLIKSLQGLKLHNFSHVPDQLSCTSLPQQWHIPRGDRIEPVPINHVVVARPKETRKRKPTLCQIDLNKK